MKPVLVCVALALLVQCGQARHLLVTVSSNATCANQTVSCDGYAPPLLTGAAESWARLDDVKVQSDLADKPSACCALNTTALNVTCADVSCAAPRVKKAGPFLTALSNKVAAEIDAICCEDAYGASDNCTSVTVVCDAMTGPVTISANVGQLANVSKTNAIAKQAACCTALPACGTTTCTGGMVAKTNTTTPDSEHLRVAQCCVYPTNATCDDVDSPQVNGTDILNCTEPGYTFPYTPPAAAKRGTPVTTPVQGRTKAEALGVCCSRVKYDAGATCAVNFNCTAVSTGATAPNATNVNASLATTDIVDEEAAVALCCQAIREEDVKEPVTVAAWIAALEECKDVDLTKALKVTGKATLVANSSGAACIPVACFKEADVEVTVSGECRFATFKPVEDDCADWDAVGTVVLDADNTIQTISGAMPAAVGPFAVAKVENVPKQVTVTRGDCIAKYTLADDLLAKIEAPKKNSATGKAASFLAAVLALLAMLVL